MEIKTNGIIRDADFQEPPPSSDRGRYLRRTAHQKLRRSYSGSRLLITALKVAGRIGVLVLMAGFLVSLSSTGTGVTNTVGIHITAASSMRGPGPLC